MNKPSVIPTPLNRPRATSFSTPTYVLTNWFHMQQATGDTRAVPTVTRLSFYAGAAAFFGAVMWTIVTTKEYPPEDMEEFRRTKAQKAGLGANVREILTAIAEMPDTMRKLGPVQLCTWLGLFCMWLYFPVAVAHNIFGADDTRSPQYQAGVQWAAIASRSTPPSALCFPSPCQFWPEDWAANIPTQYA